VSKPSDFRPLDFRLAPEYRRCGIYVAVGFVLVATATLALKWAGVDHRPWPDTIIVLAVFGAFTFLLLAHILRYRLRIDEIGIWRRRFVRWDLWPWEAFEQGKVRHGKASDQLTYPEKGWYFRNISASVFGDADRAVYEAVVRRYLVPPPAPELPETVVAKYGLRARLELTAEGVRLLAHKRDTGQHFPWRNVVRVDVLRASHDRPDFVSLDLHFPGRASPVRMTHHNGRPMWTGANADVIELFLRRHLGNGQFQVTALRGLPADTAEAYRRQARLTESDRQVRQLSRYGRYLLLAGTLAIATSALEPWNRPNPANWGRADWVAAVLAVGGVAVFMGLNAAMYFGVGYFWGRDLRRQRDEVLRWRAVHAAA
jgi:hypothetical protein